MCRMKYRISRREYVLYFSQWNPRSTRMFNIIFINELIYVLMKQLGEYSYLGTEDNVCNWEYLVEEDGIRNWILFPRVMRSISCYILMN